MTRAVLILIVFAGMVYFSSPLYAGAGTVLYVGGPAATRGRAGCRRPIAKERMTIGDAGSRVRGGEKTRQRTA